MGNYDGRDSVGCAMGLTAEEQQALDQYERQLSPPPSRGSMRVAVAAFLAFCLAVGGLIFYLLR